VTHQFQSGPVDGQRAINQVKQDLSAEKRYLASRGLLESAWDWLSGGNHSGVETYLDDQLAKLQTVERLDKSGQLTNIQYSNRPAQHHAQLRSDLPEPDQGRAGGRRVEAGRDPVIGCHAAAAKSVPECIATR
jgi:hypothetical protein